jgi:isopenicillin N synthase-like dioxygenase
VGRPPLPQETHLPLHVPNRWPAEDLCPGFRAAMEDYHSALQALSNRLLRVLALALDMPVDFFADKFDRPVATLRPLHYPPRVGDPNAGELGAGAHTDFGCFTLLLTDREPGLQIQWDGRWVDVPPREGCYIVNIGDLLQVWTNGRFKSTLHRVVSTTGRERYSTAFFVDANFDALVECLPTCCSADDPPKFKPLTAGDHVLACLKKTDKGKKAVY